jgi:hypothetical protein
VTAANGLEGATVPDGTIDVVAPMPTRYMISGSLGCAGLAELTNLKSLCWAMTAPSA